MERTGRMKNKNKNITRARHNHTKSLSSEKVLVTAKPQPASKERRIISAEVDGVALAKPNGFGKVIPATSTERSTLSISVQNWNERSEKEKKNVN
jgi:hypothetical protein